MEIKNQLVYPQTIALFSVKKKQEEEEHTPRQLYMYISFLFIQKRRGVVSERFCPEPKRKKKKVEDLQTNPYRKDHNKQ